MSVYPTTVIPQSLRRRDLIFLVFFATHIPISLLIDWHPLAPPHLIPAPLRAINSILTDKLKDPMMVLGDPLRGDGLIWFRSFVAGEMVAQLPFFFYAVWAIWWDSRLRFLPFLVYAVHTATTMQPILTNLLLGSPQLACGERAILVSVYLPYLLVPLWVAVDSYQSIKDQLARTSDKAKSE